MHSKRKVIHTNRIGMAELGRRENYEKREEENKIERDLESQLTPPKEKEHFNGGFHTSFKLHT